ncbi:ABC transporter permease [Knoellia sinensis KCTC 19936]|uniref:ABC transporter permease n=1 Tax=Knoellia sinensis KCTC 19936 TaxID=1385520 RepID=A0A0A0J706_9MICO|nr:ABC transporter permease [Knoellia sinensis]KGN32958.1 ABC transporter permease [Knoellia sinensis KCTC 19936]
MGRYTARRLLQMLPVFIGTTFLIFALVFAIPGDPIRALAGDRPISPSTVATLREEYNLDDPLVVQYGKYMAGLVQGDFGKDYNGREVVDIMAHRFPVTIRLALVAFIFEILIGLVAGVVAALRRRSYLDTLVLVTTTAIVSIPTFVLGFTLQLLLGVKLGWFPIAGISQGWYSYLLPGFVLGALSLAYVARLTRTSLVENLRADYVRTATSKGLSRKRVVGRHALRNSLIPVVTYLGIDLGALMGGAIVTEGIFNLPGIGQQVFLSVRAQEGPVVVGIVTALVLVFIFANLAVDLLYGVLDPRIRYE